MSSERLPVEGDDPVIPKDLRIAIYEFELSAKSEKEVSSEDNSILIGHMRDFALAQVLRFILEGKSTQETINYLERASQSFKKYREQNSTNPIRTWRRQH